MRLFVAPQPPRDALAELESAVAPLRAGWPAVRWAGPDRWHVTLAFLGEVAEPRLDGLRKRLARAAGRHPPVRVRIGRGGAFPAPGRARVLCAHIEGEPRALAGLRALAGSVAAGARRAGAPPPDEGRRYRPHVTLARSSQPADLGPLVEALSEFAGSAWSATRIELVRSETGPQPRHQVIGTWPLRRESGSGILSDR